MAKALSGVQYADIGGERQGMVIRGENPDHPVLLFLHGGPGTPQYPVSRATSAALEKLFTVCWWDQRGAGLSYAADIPPETMTLEQFVQDTAEVARLLMRRTNYRPLYLMGHSWGSLLGIHVASRYPELFAAYIGVSQVTNQVASERAAYSQMLARARKMRDDRTLRKLEQFDLRDEQNIDIQAYLPTRMRTMNRMGIGTKHVMRPAFLEYVWPVLTCRAYSLPRKLDYVRGIRFSMQHLMQALLYTDVTKTVTRLELPTYIMHGAYDGVVSYAQSKAYYETLDAPFKRFYTFDHSAHTPFDEEQERFIAILCGDILLK